jgi:TetR/AcrR family transcriptional regulator, transcriptional repressor for nem operon
MRYPAGHKEEVRRRLLARAARLVRRDGLARLSVARVMASAKMTVGGFYRHFTTQDAMVGEALAEALRGATPLLFGGLEPLRGRAFERAFVERYLSESHFRNVDGGCPIAANASELARAPSLLRPRDRSPPRWSRSRPSSRSACRRGPTQPPAPG